jgi:hypothetical protein
VRREKPGGQVLCHSEPSEESGLRCVLNFRFTNHDSRHLKQILRCAQDDNKINCVNGERSTVNGLKARRQETGGRKQEGQKSCHSEDHRDEAESASRRTFRALFPPAGIRVGL